MSRTRLTLGSILVIALLAVPAHEAAAAQSVVLDLRSNPLFAGAPGQELFVEGPGVGSFAYQGAVPPVCPWDRDGAFVATYDSTRPSSRASLPLGTFYTESDDFIFGAVIVVRSAGFLPDPLGFHPITLSLLNSTTTGFDRTGDLTDFRADTFDALEFAWFPQVSPLFGGPWLSPGVFGESIGDDAFANFAFGSTLFDVGTDVPRLVTVEHQADEQLLVVTVYDVSGNDPQPLPGGRVEVDLSGLTGFAVDTLSITAYEDGFNVFSTSGRSLRADVEYHRLFFASGRPNAPHFLRTILRRAGPSSAPGPGTGRSSATASPQGGAELGRKPRPGIRIGSD